MHLGKFNILLLALLVAAMVLVPCVSADENNLNEQNALAATKKIVSLDHHIPPEYFKDSQPATPLPESQMINIILSEKTLNKFSQDGQAGIIEIPVSSLDLNAKFFQTPKYQNRFVENNIREGDTIILVRMPKVMYDRFVATSKNGIIALPESYFSRYYKNLADLESSIRQDGDAIAIGFSNDPILAEKTKASASTNMTKEIQRTERSGLKSILKHAQAPDTWHVERIWFDRIYEADTYDYLIGQITPESWSASGNNDDYYSPQEREYYLNDRKDAIEIVVNYDHHTNNSTAPKVKFFPTIFDEGSDITDIDDWENPGERIIELTPGTFPDSYGYHVQIYNGKYYIVFENMATLEWYDQYVYNDQDNPSTTFTEIVGSSEFYQLTCPITDTFNSETRPIDEWAHDATLSSWRKPVDVWEYSSAQTGENFVDVYWFRSGSNSDNIGTVSYLSSSAA